MDDEPSTVATKPNGRAPSVGMTKAQLAQRVTFKELRGIFEAVVLPLMDRIAELERACGLAPSPKPGVEAIAPVVANFVNRRMAPLERLVADLGQCSMRYAGVFKAGRTYTSGEVVTCDGGLWFALSSVDTKPGVSRADWKLVVKSGRAPGTRDTDEN